MDEIPLRRNEMITDREVALVRRWRAENELRELIGDRKLREILSRLPKGESDGEIAERLGYIIERERSKTGRG